MSKRNEDKSTGELLVRQFNLRHSGEPEQQEEFKQEVEPELNKRGWWYTPHSENDNTWTGKQKK